MQTFRYSRALLHRHCFPGPPRFPGPPPRPLIPLRASLYSGQAVASGSSAMVRQRPGAAVPVITHTRPIRAAMGSSRWLRRSGHAEGLHTLEPSEFGSPAGSKGG